MHHRLYDLSVDFSRTFVWLNIDFVVMNESTGHGDLEVVRSKDDRAPLTTEVGTSWAAEH